MLVRSYKDNRLSFTYLQRPKKSLRKAIIIIIIMYLLSKLAGWLTIFAILMALFIQSEARPGLTDGLLGGDGVLGNLGLDGTLKGLPVVGGLVGGKDKKKKDEAATEAP